MKRSTLLFSLCFAVAAQCALADDTPTPSAAPSSPMPPPQAMKALRAACQADVEKLCPGVQPGGGRIVACLKEHQGEISEGCKQAIQKARPNP